MLRAIAGGVSATVAISTKVATYALLPAASSHLNEYAQVYTTTGVPFVNRKLRGLYYSDGADWIYVSKIDTDDGSQIYTDPTGRVNSSSDTVEAVLDDYDVAITSRVPYTGASADVDLGAQSITSTTSTALNTYLPESTLPVTPPASGLSFAAQDGAGLLLEQRDVFGVDTRYQPFSSDERIRQWLPQAGATAVALGLSMSFTGSTGLQTPTNASYFTSQLQTLGNGSATVKNASGGRAGPLSVFRGNGNNTGGFRFAGYGGGNDIAAVADARNFYGLFGTAAFIPFCNPSTLLQMIGFGWDAGDANMQFYSASNLGLTKTDLGAGFPANTNGLDWYLHEIWCAPSDTEVHWKLTRWDSSGNKTSVSGIETANLPLSTSFLAPQIYYSNGATALARRYSMGPMYLGARN